MPGNELELQGFGDVDAQVSATLSDFVGGEVKTPAINNRTGSALAAKAAAVSRNVDPMALYKQVNDELLETGNSPELMRVLNEVENEEKAKSVEALADAIRNNNDPAVQAAATKKTKELIETPLNLNAVLTNRAIAADGDENETKESSDVRLNLSNEFQKVENIRSEIKKTIAASETKNNKDILGAVFDWAAIFTPGVEQLVVNEIREKVMQDTNLLTKAEGFALLGNQKWDIKEWWRTSTPEQQMESLPHIMKIVREHSSVVFDDPNEVLAHDFMRSILDEGNYGEVSKQIDNVVSILDTIGLGSLVSVPFRVGKGLVKVGTAQSRLAKKVLTDTRNPASVGDLVKDANPNEARALHQSVVADTSGQAAELVHGTSRTDAIANTHLPKILNGDQVTSELNKADKLVVDNPTISVTDRSIKDVLGLISEEKAANYYFESEKVARRAAVKHSFENTTGLSPRHEMFQWGAKDDGYVVKGVYGPSESGFKSAAEARALAKIALREYGIDDSHLTILRRDGADYVPAKREGALKNGDYLVQVDYRYKFRPNDMMKHMAGEDRATDVSWNAFTYIPALRGKFKAGNLQQNLLDPASMFNPLLVQSAVAGVDKSSRVIANFSRAAADIAKDWKGLKKERQEAVLHLLKRANHENFDITPKVAAAEGLSTEEFKVVEKWRKTWEADYQLKNHMWKQTLDSQGYSKFVDEATGTEAVVREISGKQLENMGKVRYYDPADDTVKTISGQELKDFIAKGGTVGKTKYERGFVDQNEQTSRFVLSYNTADVGGAASFTRRFNDHDEILANRRGYFAVNYEDPIFIRETIRIEGGGTKQIVRATAKNTSDANTWIARQATEEGKDPADFVAELDKSLQPTSDMQFQSMVDSGLSAHRKRGERLVDATGSPMVEGAHLASPEEALNRSIASIAKHIEMNDWIEAAKKRLMAEKGHLFPQNADGVPRYPNSVDEIAANTRGASKGEVADAADVFEYIRAMEEGYTNHLDDGIKALWNGLADVVGGHNSLVFDNVEQFALNRVKGAGLTGFGKKKAFQLYLALNPARQLFVQAHQLIQISALKPDYMAKLPKDIAVLSLASRMTNGGKLSSNLSRKLAKAVGLDESEVRTLYRQWQETGLQHAIDTNNLVRHEWMQSTNGSLLRMPGKIFDGLANTGQKIGFDIGERTNVMTAWLASRDEAIRKGKNMDSASVRETVQAEARNFTWNMNRGGDMPYNSNFAALIMQFMQVPHKALTQMIFNRQLSVREKAQLAAFNMIMYGTPIVGLTQWMLDDEAIPTLSSPIQEGGKLVGMDISDKTARRFLTDGLEPIMLNYIASTMMGDEVDVDWSGLAPADMHGMLDILHTVMTGNIQEAILGTPAGQLVDPRGRVMELFKSASQVFARPLDFVEDPTSWKQIAIDAAKLSSGASNMYKAMLALELGKVKNKQGDIVADSNTMESILQALGFRTLEEARSFEVNKPLWESRQDFDDSVKEWVETYRRHLSDEGKSDEFYEQQQKTFREARRAFGNSERVNFLIDRHLRQVMRGDARNNVFLKRVLDASGWMNIGKLKDTLRKHEGVPEERKKNVLELLELLEKVRKGTK